MADKSKIEIRHLIEGASNSRGTQNTTPKDDTAKVQRALEKTLEKFLSKLSSSIGEAVGKANNNAPAGSINQKVTVFTNDQVRDIAEKIVKAIGIDKKGSSAAVTAEIKRGLQKSANTQNITIDNKSIKALAASIVKDTEVPKSADLIKQLDPLLKGLNSLTKTLASVRSDNIKTPMAVGNALGDTLETSKEIRLAFESLKKVPKDLKAELKDAFKDLSTTVEKELGVKIGVKFKGAEEVKKTVKSVKDAVNNVPKDLTIHAKLDDDFSPILKKIAYEYKDFTHSTSTKPVKIQATNIAELIDSLKEAKKLLNEISKGSKGIEGKVSILKSALINASVRNEHKEVPDRVSTILKTPHQTDKVKKNIDELGDLYRKIIKELGNLPIDSFVEQINSANEETKKASSEMGKAAKKIVEAQEKNSKALNEQTKVVERVTKDLGNTNPGPARKILAKTLEQEVATLKKFRVNAQNARTGWLGTSTAVTRSAVSTTRASQKGYPLKNILPNNKTIEFNNVITGETRTKVENFANELRKSLLTLQKNLVDRVERELKNSESGWKLVDKKLKPIGPIPGAARQQGIRLINEKKLRKDFSVEIAQSGQNFNDRPEELLKFVKEVRSKKTTEGTTKEQAVTKIAGYMKEFQLSLAPANLLGDTKMDKARLEKLNTIQKKPEYKGQGIMSPKALKEIERALEGSRKIIDKVVRKTYDEVITEAYFEQQKQLKTLTIPLAKITNTGGATFSTQHGSQRALNKFGKFETGFEELYDTLKKGSAPGSHVALSGEVRDVGLGTNYSKQANEVAKKLLKANVNEGTKSKQDVIDLYKQAGVDRALSIKPAGAKGKDLYKHIDSVVNEIKQVETDFKSLRGNDRNIERLIKEMDKIGIAAFDAVKSLDKLNFDNIYTVYDQILTQAKDSPLADLSKKTGVNYDSITRSYDKTVKQLEQLMPIVEPGRPRRQEHQENVVRLSTLGGEAYSNRKVLGPEELKSHIKDLNIIFKDFEESASVLKGYEGPNKEIIKPLRDRKKRLSSLGVPDAQAASYDRFDVGVFRRDENSIKEEFAAGRDKLKDLKGNYFKFYSGNLASMAPFGEQFQHLGRNISGVTNAITGELKKTEAAMSKIKEANVKLEGVKSEFPSLRTESEKGLITGERYGQGGYGYNVIAEMRSTSSTFEDQVVISGKLAKALTTVSKTLVAPSKGLSIYEGEGLARGKSEDVDTISPQILKENISKAYSVYQEVLGVPKAVRSRADMSFISDVESMVSVVRNQKVEVQAAKLAEIFINHFARKVTTRYGSKGVGISPILAGQNLAIQPEDTGVGKAKLPKSMGELASELFEAKGAQKGLSADLVASGNKFMVDLFKDAGKGVIVPEEAEINRELFGRFSTQMKKLYSVDVLSDIDGINQLKEVYMKKLKKKSEELYKETPIDIRFSSYGMGKRGLQTEVLESVLGNVTGTGFGTTPYTSGKDKYSTTTIKDKLNQDVYKSLLGGKDSGGELSSLSSALGYKGTGKSFEEIRDEMFERKTAGKTLTKDERAKTMLAVEKAAAIEAQSSYYSTITDEHNRERQSLVGGKFVQIVEEPGQTAGWTNKEIERKEKGARLNLPAFSAYNTIFGQDSNIIKEFRREVENVGLDTKEAYEYIKALQVGLKVSEELTNKVMSGLEEVPLGAIKRYEESIGYLRDDLIKRHPDQNMRGSLLDADRFPQAFKTRIPKTKGEGSEDFYVPSSLGRGVYPDELIAGAYGATNTARKAQHVINMAQDVQNLRDNPDDSEFGVNIGRESKPAFINKYITPMLDEIKAAKETFRQESGLATGQQVGEQQLEAISARTFNKLQPKIDAVLFDIKRFLSDENRVDPYYKTGKYQVVGGQEGNIDLTGEIKHLDSFREALKKQTEANRLPTAQDTLKKFGDARRLISRGADLVSGPQDYEEVGIQTPTAIDKIVNTPEGRTSLIKEFDLKTNNQKIEKKLENLERAKVDYYRQLAEEITGKSGAVADLFFSKKIPSVMAKATTAVVDKTEDFKKFKGTIEDLMTDPGLKALGINIDDLSKISSGIGEVSTEHFSMLSTSKGAGFPTLKSDELGIPWELAKKIKVDYTKKYKAGGQRYAKGEEGSEVKGSLLSMLNYIERVEAMISGPDSIEGFDQEAAREYIEKDLVPYVESLRYPFTGVSTVQPYKPKLLAPGTGGAAMMVPGMPELSGEGFEKLDEVIKKSYGIKDILTGKREEAFLSGDSSEASKLTGYINDLNKAISSILPKYRSHQQKLDFDGDELQVHSAKTKEARLEIAEHFKNVTKDLNSVAGAFREDFTYDAAKGHPPASEFILGSMASAAGSKHDFDYLKSPFLTKELEYMSLKDQVKLFAGDIKEGSEDLNISNLLGEFSDIGETMLRKPIDIQNFQNFKDQLIKLVETTSDVDTIAEKAAEKIEKLPGGLNAIIKAGVTKKVFTDKYSGLIEGALPKVHTGPETEKINRMAMLFEGKYDLKKGMLKEPTDYKGKLGDTRQTQMNELMRFTFQKGMDVKHAGAKSVAGTVAKYIAMGTAEAGEQLYDEVMNNESDFKELGTFAKIGDKALTEQLHSMTGFDELYNRAFDAFKNAGKKTGSLPTKDTPKNRKELVDSIIDVEGFRGFIFDLQAAVREGIIDGYVKSLKSSGNLPGKIGISNLDMAGNVDQAARDFAEKDVAKRIQDKGPEEAFNLINKYGIKETNKLYGLRTFSSGPGSQLTNYQRANPNSKIDTASLGFPAAPKYGTNLTMADTYKQAKATSLMLDRGLTGADKDKRTTAYTEMVQGTIEMLKGRQEWLNRIYENVKDADSKLLAELDPFKANERIDSGEGFTALHRQKFDEGKKSGNLEGTVEDLLDRVGIQRMTVDFYKDLKFNMNDVLKRQAKESPGAEGLEDIEVKLDDGSTITKLDQFVDNFIEERLEKIAAVLEIDRVAKFIKSNAGPLDVIGGIFPTAPRISGQSARSIDKSTIQSSDLNRMTDGGSGGAIPPGGLGSNFGLPTEGKAVPVYLVGIAPSALSNLSGVSFSGVKSNVSSAQAGMRREDLDKDINIKQDYIDRIRELTSRINQDINEKAGASYKDTFRASAISHGGSYLPKRRTLGDPEELLQSQIKQIRNVMTGKGPSGDILEGASAMGVALHEEIERYLKSSAEEGTIVTTEDLVHIQDAVAGLVTGHVDAVVRDLEGQPIKAIDIKTTTMKDFIPRLKEISASLGDDEASYENIKQKLDLTKDIDRRIAYKLEEAVSQVVFYMKALGASFGEVQFFSSLDPDIENPASVSISSNKDMEKRFKNDMMAISRAREVIKKEGESFGDLASLKELKAAEIKRKRPSIGSKPLTPAELEELKTKGRAIYDSATNKEIFRKGSLLREEDFSGKIPNSRKNMPSGKSYEDMFNIPPEISTDTGAEGLYENLKTFHQQTIAYHRIKGTDFEDITKKLPFDVKKQVGKARGEGATFEDYQQFMDTTKSLKATGGIENYEVSQAWKIFKAAVAEHMIDEMDKAKMAFDTAVAGGGGEEEYSKLQAKVERLQEFIVKGIGKASDIYTEDKRYIYPGLAKASGVYMSPHQIMQKSTGPLQDDEQLKGIFSAATEDIRNDKPLTPAIEKAQTIFKDVTDLNPEIVSLLTDGEMLKKLGPEIAASWDFSDAVNKIGRLRASLEKFRKYNITEEYQIEEQRNIEQLVKYLKNVENTFSTAGSKRKDLKGEAAWGITGAVSVPKFLAPKEQEALHNRNIEKYREFFKKAEEKGGAEVGQRTTYTTKIVDEAGNTLKNVAVDFYKYGEHINTAGELTSSFNEKTRDLTAVLQGTTRGFRGAIMRAAKWGAASTLVYGGFAKMKESVGVMAEIETSMAQLSMVMNPVTTNFDMLGKSAIGFAKQYGVPVKDVLRSMKIFAQQGLTQAEVIDRTQTATLAANVTTLDAKEATEALTAAMKVFDKEVGSSMVAMDAWSEVEARNAITAGDMANAIKKSASAAKNAGFTFNQLNGIVAAIGSTTRQTGKEVGTSMRFIVRRLASDKGPKELAKLGIPVLTETGDLRKGFDVLDDLAMKWDVLNKAQKIGIAQSIGGTRQYNSLLVLMDNWDQALKAAADSTNSKGSSERRNLELMKTYTKQVEQTKAAMTELQISIGKIVLPTFKFGVKGIKTALGAINSIPGPIKAASAAMVAFLALLSKGGIIFDKLSNLTSGGGSIFGGIKESLSSEVRKGGFEVFGKGDKASSENFGLKNITGSNAGKSLDEFQTAMGKTAFIAATLSKKYNSFLADMATGTGDAAGKIGAPLESIGKKLEAFGSKIDDTADIFQVIAALIPGLSDDFAALGGQLTGKGLEGAGKIFQKGGSMFNTTSDLFGETIATKMSDLANENENLAKTFAPILTTVVGLSYALKKVGEAYLRTTKSAQDYAKAQYGIRRTSDETISYLGSMISKYDELDRKLEKINALNDPVERTRRKDLGTYESPLLSLASLQEEAKGVTNDLAASNINLIAGYDQLGNAILKTTGDLKGYLTTAEKGAIRDRADVEVDVLSKFVQDLTRTDGPEKWKSEFKKLLEEAPLFGELVAAGIKVSPAKALSDLSGKLNTLLAEKNKAPLAQAFDKEIKNYQVQIAKVREQFNLTYSDFKKTLSEIPTKGLGDAEISKIFSAEGLRKGYELLIDVEPKFNLAGIKGKVNWQDIVGAEVLNRAVPEVGGNLEAISTLTKEALEQQGRAARKGAVRSNDIVLFDDLAEKYNMAGNQAIVSIKKNADGVFEWVATYFNTKTLNIEERTFDKDMQSLVDAVFPSRMIEKELEDRMESLNEFVAGAGAGLRGISAKDFKKDFNLGERFFSDIATTTLIQSNKGFNPTSGGFGESPFQANWADDFKKYYVAPMEEYRVKLEQLEKLRLEGLDGEISLATGLYEEMQELQNILKNNQIIMQYRGVFVDLMKTMEAGTRTLQENLAVETSRSQLNKASTGVLKGIDPGLANLTNNKRKFSELNESERALLGSSEYRAAATSLKGLNIRKGGAQENVYASDRALAAIKSISDVSTGFGASLSIEDMKKYTETILKTGDTGIAELKLETSKVSEHTGATVDRLDTLIEYSKNPEALDKELFGFIKTFSTEKALKETSPGKIVDALDSVSGRRQDAIKEGNFEIVTASNKIIDVLIKNLAEQVGVKKAISMSGDTGLASEEVAQRLFPGMEINTLVGELKGNLKEERKWFGLKGTGGTPTFDKNVDALKTLQEANNKEQLFSSKSTAKAAAAATIFTAFQKADSGKMVKSLDNQIGLMKEQLTTKIDAGAPEGEIKSLSTKIAATQEIRGQKSAEEGIYRTIRDMSGLTLSLTQLSRSLGLSDRQIKYLGGTALSTYAAFSLLSKQMGVEMPKSAREYGELLGDAAASYVSGERIGPIKAYKTKKAAESFMEDFNKRADEFTSGDAPSEAHAELEKQTELLQKISESSDEAAKLAAAGGKGLGELKVIRDTYAKAGENDLADKIDIVIKAINDKGFQGFAGGGMVLGKGGPRSDSNLIKASQGEYVFQHTAVNKLGKPALDFMNEKGELPFGRPSGISSQKYGGIIPGYALGGMAMTGAKLAGRGALTMMGGPWGLALQAALMLGPSLLGKASGGSLDEDEWSTSEKTAAAASTGVAAGLGAVAFTDRKKIVAMAASKKENYKSLMAYARAKKHYGGQAFYGDDVLKEKFGKLFSGKNKLKGLGKGAIGGGVIGSGLFLASMLASSFADGGELEEKRRPLVSKLESVFSGVGGAIAGGGLGMLTTGGAMSIPLALAGGLAGYKGSEFIKGIGATDEEMGYADRGSKIGYKGIGTLGAAGLGALKFGKKGALLGGLLGAFGSNKAVNEAYEFAGGGLIPGYAAGGAAEKLDELFNTKKASAAAAAAVGMKDKIQTDKLARLSRIQGTLGKHRGKIGALITMASLAGKGAKMIGKPLLKLGKFFGTKGLEATAAVSSKVGKGTLGLAKEAVKMRPGMGFITEPLAYLELAKQFKKHGKAGVFGDIGPHAYGGIIPGYEEGGGILNMIKAAGKDAIKPKNLLGTAFKGVLSVTAGKMFLASMGSKEKEKQELIEEIKKDPSLYFANGGAMGFMDPNFPMPFKREPHNIGESVYEMLPEETRKKLEKYGPLLEAMKNPPVMHASGGSVFSRGGPRDDRTLALVSNGEYILNTEAAKGIGYDNLNYMNRRGSLPKYADGGAVGDYPESVRSPEFKQQLKTVRTSLDQDSVNRLGQLLATEIGATLVGYFAEGKSLINEVANNRKQASKESQAIYEIIKSNPEAAQKVFDKQGVRTTDANATQLPTEERSRVLSSGAERSKIEGDITSIRESMVADFDMMAKEAAALEERMEELEIAERFKKELEEMDKAIDQVKIFNEVKDMINEGLQPSYGLKNVNPFSDQFSFNPFNEDFGRKTAAYGGSLGLMSGMYNPQQVDFGVRNQSDLTAEQSLVFNKTDIKDKFEGLDFINPKAWAERIGYSIKGAFKDINIKNLFNDPGKFFGIGNDSGVFDNFAKSFGEGTRSSQSAGNVFKTLEESGKQRDLVSDKISQLLVEKQYLTAREDSGAPLSSAEEKTLEGLDATIETLKGRLGEFSDAIGKATQSLDVPVFKAGLDKITRDSVIASVDTRASFDLNNRTNPDALVNPALKGFSQQSFFTRKEDYSPQQKLYEGLSGEAKKAFQNVSFIAGEGMESQVQEIIELENQLRGLEKERLAEEAQGLHEGSAIQEKIDMTKKRMAERELALNDTANRIKVYSDVTRAITEFTASLQNVDRVLKNIDVESAFMGLEGMDKYKEARGSMFGSGSPIAGQAITPIDRAKAWIYGGTPLVNQKSNQFDVRRAQINDQLISGNLQGRQYDEAVLEQMLLPLAEQESIDNQKQLYKNQLSFQGMDAYEQYAKDLTKRLDSGELDETPELKKAVELMRDQVVDNLVGVASGDQEGPEKFEDIKKRVGELDGNITAQFNDFLSKSNLDALASTGDKQLNELQNHTKLLADIAGARNVSKEEIAEMFPELIKPSKSPFGSNPIMPEVVYASGGKVFGGGTPTSDSIPAYLSRDEYVIKASSAKSLGYGALDHINSTGEIPGLAEGGSPEESSEGGILGWFKKKVKDKVPESDAKKKESRIERQLREALGKNDGGKGTPEEEFIKAISKGPKSLFKILGGGALSLGQAGTTLMGLDEERQKQIQEALGKNDGGKGTPEEEFIKAISKGPKSLFKILGGGALSLGQAGTTLMGLDEERQKQIQEALGKAGGGPALEDDKKYKELLGRANQPFFGRKPKGEHVYTNIGEDGSIRKLIEGEYVKALSDPSNSKENLEKLIAKAYTTGTYQINKGSRQELTEEEKEKRAIEQLRKNQEYARKLITNKRELGEIEDIVKEEIAKKAVDPITGKPIAYGPDYVANNLINGPGGKINREALKPYSTNVSDAVSNVPFDKDASQYTDPRIKYLKGQTPTRKVTDKYDKTEDIFNRESRYLDDPEKLALLGRKTVKMQVERYNEDKKKKELKFINADELTTEDFTYLKQKNADKRAMLARVRELKSQPGGIDFTANSGKAGDDAKEYAKLTKELRKLDVFTKVSTSRLDMNKAMLSEQGFGNFKGLMKDLRMPEKSFNKSYRRFLGIKDEKDAAEEFAAHFNKQENRYIAPPLQELLDKYKVKYPVKHAGGPITKSGPHFMQAGEWVTPKGFANGGRPEMLNTASAVGALEIKGLDELKISLDALKNNLSEVRLKIDTNELVKVDLSVPLKVDAPESIPVTGIPEDGIKIKGIEEGIKVTGIPEDGIKIKGIEEGIKVTGIPEDGIKVTGIPEEGIKVTGIPEDGIKIKGIEEGIKVTGIPEDGIKVNIPAEGIKVTGIPEDGIKVNAPESIPIEIPSGGLEIKGLDRFEQIVNKFASVDVSVKEQSSVGADKAVELIDELDQRFKQTFINLNGDLEVNKNKIEILNNNLNDKLEKFDRIDILEEKVNNQRVDLDSKENELTSALAEVNSKLGLLDTQIDTRIRDQQTQIYDIKTRVHSI